MDRDQDAGRPIRRHSGAPGAARTSPLDASQSDLTRPSADAAAALESELQRTLGARRLSRLRLAGPQAPGEIYYQHLLQVAHDLSLIHI